MKRIIAILIVLLLLLLLFWIVFPGKKNKADTGAENALATPEAAVIQSHVTLDRRRYPLTVLEPCGYTTDGQFRLLAVTLDDNGMPQAEGPQFLIQSAPWETIADFYTGRGDVHRVSQRGDNRMALENGHFTFRGATDGDGLPIEFHLTCPR